MKKAVWVIGGDSGIGEATARELAERNYRVHITGRNIDVRDELQMARQWKAHVYDGVVYCAGINILMHDRELNVDLAQEIFDVNVFGFMRLMRFVAEEYTTGQASEREGQFSVVAVSSDAATRPMRTSMAYCASKAALNMCVKQSARELAPYVRVNAVSPGMTADTGMTRYIDSTVPRMRGWTDLEARTYERSQIPMQRRAKPEEIAHVICDVYEGPTYQTGSVVEVNGGR